MTAMYNNKRYVSVSIRADVYDRLFKLSRQVIPGTTLSIPKVIEVITNAKLTESIAPKKSIEEK